jgi:predicted HTH domain antitoxin
MLTISDEILNNARMTEKELREQFALFLYSKKKFSMGQACKFTGLNILEFQELMFNNNVYINYSVKDLDDDMRTLNEP